MKTPCRFAVIGDPILHSRSPEMHEAAYRALNLPHRYERRHVPPAGLESAIEDLRRGLFDGYNVTAPHKTHVIALVDAIDDSAILPGCANTLARDAEGRVIAFNTDVRALGMELEALAPERDAPQWAGSKALVLGTGGAARAVLVALATQLGVRDIVVRGRSARAPAFLAFTVGLARSISGLHIATEDLHVGGADDEGRFSTVVQATSDGTLVDAVSWKHLPESAIALDVIYGPAKTAFLRASADLGLRSSDGLGMLVRQGALAFERWLGVPAPLLAMRKAVDH